MCRLCDKSWMATQAVRDAAQELASVAHYAMQFKMEK